MLRSILAASLITLLSACASSDGATRDDDGAGAAAGSAAVASDAQDTDEATHGERSGQIDDANDNNDDNGANEKTEPVAAWDWAGCENVMRKSMVIKCPAKKVTLSLGKLTSEGPPSDEVMLQAERNAIGGTLSTLRPELLETYGDALETRMITLPQGQLSATFLDVAEGPKTRGMKLLTTALPFEERGQHFVVLYHCMAAEVTGCQGAIASLITEGLPKL